jgi:hypothetical protein
MHGKRGAVTPSRHGNNVLETKTQGNQFILNCVRRCGRGNALNDHPVWFRSVVAYEVERDISLLEKNLEIQIIAVSRSLAGYARFHSVCSKT